MHRNLVLFVSCLLLLVLSLSASAWEIDGDRVWQNDSNCYISVTPHTLHSSGWAVITVKTHSYSGNIDACLGFNTTAAKPSKPAWKNHWENTTTQHQAYFYNVTSIEPSIEPYDGSVFDYGNDYNTYQRTITYYRPVGWDEETNITTYELTTANVSFDSYEEVGDGDDYMIYWHTDHSEWVEWTRVPSSRYHSVNYDFMGFDKWYYATDLTVQAGKEYTLRFWVDVPVSLERSSGKYFFAVKPSTETIGEAVNNGHFYCLDPWWDSCWQHRKQVTVSHVNASGETLVNFPAYINVSKEPEMQNDYDDVVFVDSNNNAMAFELENYTTDHAIFWVNITSLPNIGASFWMYYGNDGATSQEDPESVWDSNTVMVHHFEDLNDSTSYDNDGTNHGSTYNSTWLLDGEREFDGTDDYVDCGSDESLVIEDDFTIEAWVYPKRAEGTYPDNRNAIYDAGGFGSNYCWLFIANNKLFLQELYSPWMAVATPSGSIQNNVWYFVSATKGDGGDDVIRLYINGTERANGTLNITMGVPGEIGKLAGSDYFNGTIDEVRISNVSRSADWINESYQLVTNQSDFVTFGAVEDVPPFPPTNLTSSSGLFWDTGKTWINYTWEPDPNSTATVDSYNVSLNGVWDNGSSQTYRNVTIDFPEWANISVYSYNATYGTLSNQSADGEEHALIPPANISLALLHKKIREGDISMTSDTGIVLGNTLLYSILFLVSIIFLGYSFVDNKNRLYGNVVAAFSSAIMFFTLSVWSITGNVLYGEESEVMAKSLSFLCVMLGVVAVLYTIGMVLEIIAMKAEEEEKALLDGRII